VRPFPSPRSVRRQHRDVLEAVRAIVRWDLDDLRAKAGVPAAGALADLASQIDRAATLDELRGVARRISDERHRVHRQGQDRDPSLADDCFFDPRHERAAQAVSFAASGGAMERLPACATCASRIADRRTPALLQVDLNDEPTPYWHSRLHAAYFGYDRRSLDELAADVARDRGGRGTGEPIGLFDWIEDLVDLSRWRGP